MRPPRNTHCGREHAITHDLGGSRRTHRQLQTLSHLLLIAPDRTVEFFRRYIVPTLACVVGSILDFTDRAAQFVIAHRVFHITILHLRRGFS